MDLVLEGMRLANSTDKEFSCNHCFKPFEDVSQLLRHVSHSNLCLSHYGPDFVKGLREECRRKSKRKWIALNEESVRQKAKERGRKRNCYVPNSVKHSEMGRAFTDVFRDVFNEYKKQAREDVKEHSEKRWLFLTKDQISDALDESFGDLFEVVRSMQYTKEEEGSNEEIMDRMFVKIEARFRTWDVASGSEVIDPITINILSSGENQAARCDFSGLTITGEMGTSFEYNISESDDDPTLKEIFAPIKVSGLDDPTIMSRQCPGYRI